MLYDSWFDFGPRGADLAYPDALTRSYLAFVYRPSLGAPEVPARGLEGVEAPLDALPALPAPPPLRTQYSAAPKRLRFLPENADEAIFLPLCAKFGPFVTKK